MQCIGRKRGSIIKSLAALLLAAVILLGFCACTLEEQAFVEELAQNLYEEVMTDEAGDWYAEPVEEEPETSALPKESASPVAYGKSYDSKDEVALYIHLFNELPPNYISKSEARKLGWEGGDVKKFAPGKCIGGSSFGNREGLLPDKAGRTYTECDIDTLDTTSRGAKRIVFSNDGLIYYTEDHYRTFTLLYGEE